VVTSGAALAALLASLALTPQDVDGFILGEVSSVTSHTMHDHDEATTSAEALTATITALPTLATSFSFYEPSGSVDEGKLAALVKALGQPVLGWFVWRPDSTPTPSMREQVLVPAMLRSLRQLQQQSAAAKGGGEAGAAERPMLFATMSGGVRHGGATTAFQCRMFQNRPDSVELKAVRLNVLNIRGGRGFSPASPLAALPRVPYLPPPAADLQSPTAESVAAHHSKQPSLGGMRGSGGASSSGDAASSPNGVSPTAAAADGNEAASSHTSNATQSSPAGGEGEAQGRLRDAAASAVAGLADQAAAAEVLYWSLVREVELLEPALSTARADLAARHAAVAALHESLAV